MLILSEKDRDKTFTLKFQSQNISTHKTYGDLLWDIQLVEEKFTHSKFANVALFSDDLYIFTVYLLGLLAAKKQVYLLPNPLSATFSGIQAAVEDSIYLVLDPQLLSLNSGGPRDQLKNFETNPSENFVTICTSGSTGYPKLVPKSLEVLLKEVNTLEKLWGNIVEDSVIVSTVGYQHIYGLLFYLLWPLSQARAILSAPVLYPEVIDGLVQNKVNFSLVSSPAHLTRFPSNINIKGWRNKIQGFFSSGAPLPAETSQNYFKDIGLAPIEVLGSTETGGIAWFQTKDNIKEKLWKPMPGVTLIPNENGTEIRSPFIYSISSEKHYIEDIVKIRSNGDFIHLGRKDKIIKIEGKRFSPAEMERNLKGHAYINEAVIISYVSGEEGKEKSFQKLAGVLSLTSEGAEAFSNSGKKNIVDEIKRHLLKFHEAITIPKKWRIVPEIPLNSQSKRSYEQLFALFKPIPSESEKWFSVLQVNLSSSFAEFQILIPDNLIYFKGHFNDFAVLPWVVQLDWAVKSAQKYFNITDSPVEIKNLKFFQLARPGIRARLLLVLNEAKHHVRFSLLDRQQKYSTGLIQFPAAI